MITITVYQNQKEVMGFRCFGHSGYADAGKDIVCAGVSALVLNTINSIEAFTDAKYQVDTDAKTGLIDFQLNGNADHDTALLINAMILGLQGIQNDYGNKYIILRFKEV